jgi:hypothetical protein
MLIGVGLFNLIDTINCGAAAVLQKNGFTLQACRLPSEVGFDCQDKNSGIFQLLLGKLAIAAFTIDKMVVWRMIVTIGSIDSSSTG